ncbi:hypothetical protein VPJ68_06480, partial [Parabacteroides distasonis]
RVPAYAQRPDVEDDRVHIPVYCKQFKHDFTELSGALRRKTVQFRKKLPLSEIKPHLLFVDIGMSVCGIPMSDNMTKCAARKKRGNCDNFLVSGCNILSG